ncbi:hypothetical protein PR048_032116 [Dryococelus australis]|uniref:Uncharacterized protein n=1 Tax=Dryococelus australis TaxID=614101 RepID=A0ABQ9G1A9_9NEOP|nr:hypothetical protein PR048_032116 [Dryococelus australis]
MPHCHVRGVAGAAANEQTSEARLYTGLWILAFSRHGGKYRRSSSLASGIFEKSKSTGSLTQQAYNACEDTCYLANTSVSSQTLLRDDYDQVAGVDLRQSSFSHAESTVAERIARSPPTKANRVQSRLGHRIFAQVGIVPDDAVVQGSPVSPTSSFRRCSILTSITLIGSQDLAVKSRPNVFTHSHYTRTSLEFLRNEILKQVLPELRSSIVLRVLECSENIQVLLESKRCYDKLKLHCRGSLWHRGYSTHVEWRAERFGRLFTSRSREQMRVNRRGYGVAPECKDGENRRSPPADQQHRQARFAHAKIRKRTRRESNPAHLGRT